MAGQTNPGVKAMHGGGGSTPRRPVVVHTPTHDDGTAKAAALRRKLLVWGLPPLGLLLIAGACWFFLWPATPERRTSLVNDEAPSVPEKKFAADPEAAPTRAPQANHSVQPKELPKKVEPRPPEKVEQPVKKPAPPEQKAPEKKPEKKPIVATNVDPIPVSAVRLLQQQMTDAAGVRLAYDHKLVDIRGIYARSTMNVDFKPAPAPSSASPASPEAKASVGLRVDFALEQKRDAGSLTVWPESLETALRQLLPGQCVTLRGVYEAPGKLHHARIVQSGTPADELYHGKEIEIAGYVAKVAVAEGTELATLRFEPGVTDSVIGVECSFKKQEPHQPDGMAAGQFVIVRGRCGIPTFNVVRIHDCQIVYDFSAKADVPRIMIENFVRDYDQYAREGAAADSGDADVPVSAKELLQAHKFPAEAAKRFGQRWLEVEGTVETIDPSQLAVILEGGTDQGLKVKCLFVRRQFAALNPAPQMTIRGWCSGIDGKFVRLDNCELVSPAPRERTGPRLDAEFFPYRADKPLVYETAYVAPPASRSALRQTFTFKENGVIEIAARRTGQLVEKIGGLAGGVKWNSKGTTATPLILHHRLRAGHVEIGQAVGDKLRPSGVWEPMIAIGMQAGDRWTWGQGDKKYVYTVVGFSEHAGALSATVTKTLETAGAGTPMESVHVYARGIGEVERRVYEAPPKSPKRLLVETKLVR